MVGRQQQQQQQQNTGHSKFKHACHDIMAMHA
jgi:hypothetical protein